jgi:hypothetical protein
MHYHNCGSSSIYYFYCDIKINPKQNQTVRLKIVIFVSFRKREAYGSDKYI